jgi:hypothetical protein
MTLFHFTVEVSGIDPAQDGFESRFYGNGVDDVLIYVSGGRVFLAFDREAWNEEAALKGAASDIVERGGQVTRVIWDEPRASD